MLMLYGVSHIPQPTSPHWLPPIQRPVFRQVATVPPVPEVWAEVPPKVIAASAWKPAYSPLPRSSRPRMPKFEPDEITRIRKSRWAGVAVYALPTVLNGVPALRPRRELCPETDVSAPFAWAPSRAVAIVP